ncbi:WD40 repeat domain-containing protein [Streptomyces sp. NPDC059008]|uniref:WD40 repeat domain-containing protein n=1 Tax=Streptomyces sp. NPDC059008 TaxID=3346693 RepID=UPI0036879D75
MARAPAAPATAERLHGAPLWSKRLPWEPTSLAVGVGLIAAAGRRGGVRVLDLEGGEEHGHLALPGGVTDLAFSPDGHHLALVGPRGYGLWRAADGRLITRPTATACIKACWMGSGVVAIADGRRVTTFDTDGTTQWSTSPLPTTATDMACAQGGRLLAVSLAGHVRCFMPMRREPVAVHAYGGAPDNLTLSVDGHWAVSSAHHYKTVLWETHRPAEQPVECEATSGRHAPEFSESGHRLAVPAERHLSVWSIPPRKPERLAVLPVCASALAWRPGHGDMLATAGSDHAVRLWRTSTRVRSNTDATLAAWHLTTPATRLAWIGQRMLAVAERGGRVTLLGIDADAASHRSE